MKRLDSTGRAGLAALAVALAAAALLAAAAVLTARSPGAPAPVAGPLSP